MFVVRTDSDKRRRWLQLFGVETLPVKRPFARPLLVGTEEELAFELDCSQLPSMARYRFAGVMARELRLTYGEALRIELDGWPIPAGGLVAALGEKRELLHRDETAVKRPFFVGEWIPAFAGMAASLGEKLRLLQESGNSCIHFGLG